VNFESFIKGIASVSGVIFGVAAIFYCLIVSVVVIENATTCANTDFRSVLAVLAMLAVLLLPIGLIYISQKHLKKLKASKGEVFTMFIISIPVLTVIVGALAVALTAWSGDGEGTGAFTFGCFEK